MCVSIFYSVSRYIVRELSFSFSSVITYFFYSVVIYKAAIEMVSNSHVTYRRRAFIILKINIKNALFSLFNSI